MKTNLSQSLTSILPSTRTGWVVLALLVLSAFFFGLYVSNDSASDNRTEVQSSERVPEKTTRWTCSMHPQIQLPEPGKCPICFMDLIPLTSVHTVDTNPRLLRISENARALASINTSPVIRGFPGGSIRLPGMVTYNEEKMTDITARVEGRIERMYVNYTGAEVSEGDTLYALYSPVLLATIAELRQAALSLSRIPASQSILYESARATFDASKEKLHLFGLTDSQIARYQDESSTDNMISFNAPFSGVVIEKHGVEGEYVKAGSSIYKLADLQTVWLSFEAYEADLPMLHVGQNIAFTTSSRPGESLSAEVTFINPVVDPRKRTVSVRAEYTNKRGLLKPSMLITGEIERSYATSSSNENKPLLIPATAPLLTGKRALVYVAIPNQEQPTYEGREVNLGAKAGDYYIVVSGVSEGDQVVTNGAFKIDSELQLRAKASMMSPPPNRNPAETHASADNAVLQQLTPLYDAYFRIQMALADDSKSFAHDEYAAFAKMSKALDLSSVAMSEKMILAPLLDTLRHYAQNGVQSKDMVEARDAFYYLSKTLINLHDTFGHSDKRQYYLTFCPMARENKGAYWLQTVDTVYNSFYGAMMLRCGEIKQSLPSISEGH